jgi:hypothetical protein
MLLEMILSDPGLGAPLFVTITSLPTATIASKLASSPDLVAYYINLDAMQADPALLERLLSLRWTKDTLPTPLPSHKLSKLARILSRSPSPHYHLKRLSWVMCHQPGRPIPNGQQRGIGAWERNLDDILAAPESEAWRLIDEHNLEGPFENKGDVSDDSEGWDLDDERDSDGPD